MAVLFFLTLLLVPLAEITAQPATTAAPTKSHAVVFVDFEHVFTNYYKTRLANDQLMDMSDTINRNRAEMVGQYDQVQKDYAVLREKLIAPEIAESEADKIRIALDEKLIELKKLDEQIEAFNKAQEVRWVEQNRRIRGTLVEDIQKKLSGYMKARNYLAVIDRSQVNDKKVPAVLYVDETVDVTQEFLNELNK